MFLFQGMDFAAYEKTRQTLPMTYQFVHRMFVEKALKFQPGQRGVVCNGKVCGVNIQYKFPHIVHIKLLSALPFYPEKHRKCYILPSHLH